MITGNSSAEVPNAIAMISRTTSRPPSVTPNQDPHMPPDFPPGWAVKPSGIENNLERAVLLLLEGFVGLRRLGQRQVMRRELLGAKRVVVAADEGHDVVDPRFD